MSTNQSSNSTPVVATPGTTGDLANGDPNHESEWAAETGGQITAFTTETMMATPQASPGVTYQGKMTRPEHPLDIYTAGSTPQFHLENSAKVKTLSEILGGAIEDKEQMIKITEFANVNSALDWETNNEGTFKENTTGIGSDPYVLSVKMQDLILGRVLFAIKLSPAHLISQLVPNLSMSAMAHWTEWWPSVDIFLTFASANVRLNLNTTVFKHRIYKALKASGAMSGGRGGSLRILKTESGTQRTSIDTDNTQTYAYSATLPNRTMANPYRKLFHGMGFEEEDSQGRTQVTDDEETDWLVCFVEHDMMGTLRLVEDTLPVLQVTMSVKINRERTELRRVASSTALADNQIILGEYSRRNSPHNNIPGPPSTDFPDANKERTAAEIKLAKEKFTAGQKKFRTTHKGASEYLKIAMEGFPGVVLPKDPSPSNRVLGQAKKRGPKFGVFKEKKTNKKTGEVLIDAERHFPAARATQAPTDSPPLFTTKTKIGYGKFHKYNVGAHKDFLEGSVNCKRSGVQRLNFRYKISTKTFPGLKNVYDYIEQLAPRVQVDTRLLNITMIATKGQNTHIFQSAEQNLADIVPNDPLAPYHGRSELVMGIKDDNKWTVPKNVVIGVDMAQYFVFTAEKNYIYITLAANGAEIDWYNGAEMTISINASEHVGAGGETPEEVDPTIAEAREEYFIASTTGDAAPQMVWEVEGISQDKFTHYCNIYNQDNSEENFNLLCEMFDGTIFTPVTSKMDMNSLAYVNGYETGMGSSGPQMYAVVQDQNGEWISEVVPNLDGVATEAEYEARIKLANNTHPEAEHRDRSIFHDPLLIEKVKLMDKKEYEEFKASEEARTGILITLFTAIIGVVVSAVEGALHNEGNNEVVTAMLLDAATEEATLRIPKNLQHGKFVERNVTKNPRALKPMTAFDYEREWAIATGTTETAGFSENDMRICVRETVGIIAERLNSLIAMTDDNGDTLKKTKRHTAIESPIDMEFSDLEQDIQATINPTYEAAFNEMQEFKTLIAYDLIVRLCPDLFEHKFGPPVNSMKAKRDVEYEQMLQTALFTGTVYQYVLNKYHMVLLAKNSPEDFSTKLRELLS